MSFDFHGIYSITPRIVIEPFTVHPLEQWLIWVRPISADYDWSQFDFNVYTSAYYEAPKAYLTFEEHFLVAQKSVVDKALAPEIYEFLPITKEDWAFSE